MNKKKLSKIPGAAESNAGDDFHVLWTVRKCLELLNFENDGLQLVAIEGLSSTDEDAVTDDTLLAVDLTEYYGGEDFDTATRVIVSQLKYSTRHPDKTWTVSSICTGKKHAWEGSIIHRLATFYEGFSIGQPLDTLLQKLVIKLVSNRPIAYDLQTALTAVQQSFSSNNATSDLKTILKKLEPPSAAIIKRLADNSGLKDPQFLGFIRVLDFSDTQVGSRFFQEQFLLKAIAQIGSYKTEDEYNRLYQLVHGKMMPEARGKHTIKQVDILYKFGFSDITDLFPVKARFQTNEQLIEREQMASIIKGIQTTSEGKLILYGGAGMGKSSIVQMIPEKLPSGSITLLFDCYGAGTYLDSDDKRHKPRNAFLQLSNDLALLAGTPLLVARDLLDDDYLREFKKRLDLASQVIRKVNPAAIVLVIVDAADNSVHAAQVNGEASFVQALMRISVPTGCRLVFTSRTGRRQTLPLYNEVDKIEISSFSLAETDLYLKRYYHSLSLEVVEEFYRLTNATPRVMTYALGMPGDTITQKLQPLKPGGKTLNDIFKLRIQDAQRRSGNDATIQDFLHYLILLPRPIPLAYIHSLCRVSNELLQDMQTDLWQGLILQNDQFSFRDEDFENFLRSSYPANSSMLNAIADAFLATAETDDYASLHLGNALRHADRDKELIEIVLNGKFQKFPQDPIRLKEIIVERTMRAIELSASNSNKLDILKLQLVAAEAAKTNTVLEDILLNNAELASAFGNAATAQKLYFQSGNPSWFGSVHFRSAAVHSRNSATHSLTREHLKKAKEWVQYRANLTDEERKDFQLTERDLAYAAEAVLRLSGAKACANWLNRWSPRSFAFEAVEILLNSLIEQGEQKQLAKWLKTIQLPLEIKLLVTQTYFRQGLKPPFSLGEMATHTNKVRRLSKFPNFSMSDEIISFCEYAIIYGVSHDQIREWLQLVKFKKPQYVPSFYTSEFSEIDKEKHDMDIMFRKSCLQSQLNGEVLEASHFYPATLVDGEKASSQEQHGNREEREKFNRLYKHILPVYQVRAAFLFGKATYQKLKKQLDQVLQAIEKDYELHYRFKHQLPHLYRFLVIRLLDIAFYVKKNHLIWALEKAFTIRHHNNTSLYLSLADRLSTNNYYHSTVLQLLQKVEQSIDSDTLSGSDQLSHYTKAAIIGSRISYPIGQFYFDKMVRTSEEIDEEGFNQIKAFSGIILSEENWSQPRLAFEFARFVEYCYHHLNREHFPWQEAIKGITRLCPATSMAILCRWDHRAVHAYQEYLVETLEESLRQQYIDHITAAALLPLNQYYWPGVMELIELIIKGFDKSQDYERKEIFVKDFIHDLELHFSSNSEFKTLQDFGSLIKDGRYLNVETVAEYQSYCSRVASLLQLNEHAADIKEPKYKKSAKKKSGKRHFKNIDLTASLEIKKALHQARSGENDVYFDCETFFDEMRQLVNSSDYAKHLSALLYLDADEVGFWYYKSAFLKALNEWNFHPDVKKWKQLYFFSLLKQHFGQLVSYGHLRAKDLEDLAEAFEASKEQLGSYLSQLLPEYLDSLQAPVLYEMLPFTTVGISKEEKEELMNWMLPRWSQKIKPDLGDGVWNEKYILPAKARTTTAYFLRYFFGHPNKNIRWRAAHSLRRFAKLGKSGIVIDMIPLLNQTNNAQFQDNSYLFYWLSAKLYFWIAMERISKENISFILPYADSCLRELKDNITPHALVRYFVKSICNQIFAFRPSVFKNADKAFIKTVNMLPDAGQKKLARPQRMIRQSRRDTRFQFDTLDTIPYWYEPMIRSLGLDFNEFLQTADSFITQRWGYTGNRYDNDPAHTEKWGLTSNGHGTEPVVEKLAIYFEYHAMFCAAGQLLENAAIHPKEEDDDDNDYWPSRWGLNWADFWLADFRSPLPLLPEFWQKVETHGDWEFQINLTDFDKVIGLNNIQKTGSLVVHSNTRIHYGKDYETSSVSSVLVHPNYGSSLLRAMQTSDDLRPYLPFENDRLKYDTEETDFPFEKGWIINHGSDRECIDDKDEFYHNISKYRVLIGTEFQKWANLQFSPDFSFSFCENLDEWVSRLHVWDNNDEDQRYGSFTSDGERLEIKTSVLFQFLNATNQCLLINCEIKRHPERSYEHIEYYPPYTRLYLIYPDGRIETLSGNYQLGQEARSGV